MKQLIIGRIEVPWKMSKKGIEQCIKKATEDKGVFIAYEDIDLYLKPEIAEQIKTLRMGMTEGLLDTVRKAIHGSWNPPVGGE